MTDIKLYGYSTSPYVRKVGCFLYYKKLPFTFVPVNPIQPEQIAFTGQTQVPVLEIDGEWRKDSTPLGIWLDKKFPELPLIPGEAKDKVLEIDRWISETFIVAGFRGVVEADMDLAYRTRAWRLAAILSAQTPLPEEVRNAWPQFIKQAPFIKAMAASMDQSESMAAMNGRIFGELIEHFAGGPYLGGLETPSLADFALYPQVAFGYATGMESELSIAEVPQLKEWLADMQSHLPANPFLVEDFLLVNNF